MDLYSKIDSPPMEEPIAPVQENKVTEDEDIPF
jgi:hypothetical protein